MWKRLVVQLANRRRAAIFISVLSIVVLLTLFHPNPKVDAPQKELSKGESRKGEIKASEQHAQTSAISQRPKRFADIEPLDHITLSEAKLALQVIAKENEARHSRMLVELVKGKSTTYVLGVEPPSADEITLLRKQFSDLQKKVSAESGNKDAIDEFLGKIVEEYDPFGAGGKKVIVVTIQDKVADGMFGFTYSSESFESEIAKFNSSNTDFEFPNMRSYGRRDGVNLERFSALIKDSPKE